MTTVRSRRDPLSGAPVRAAVVVKIIAPIIQARGMFHSSNSQPPTAPRNSVRRIGTMTGGESAFGSFNMAT